MAFQVEQKIKGRTYLYEVESYYDKDKKQSRQRRKYLGRKPTEKSIKIEDISSFISKSYGTIIFLDELSKKLNLKNILEAVFPNHYTELLSLIYYQITASDPMYLFEHWYDEHYLSTCKRLDSSSISRFFEQIGSMQSERFRFFELWTKQLSPLNVIYYDITSLSSYSENIDFVEWGYNRDNEDLPQINLGVVSCQTSGLPIYYRLFPGSIVDVTTLKNTVNYLNLFGLENILLVMDKGFYSEKNIIELYHQKFQFIMPVPYTLKKVKNMIKKYSSKICSPMNAFQFNNDVLYYQSDTIEIDKNIYNAHIYFNERRKVEKKQELINKILEIEKQHAERTFPSRKLYNKFSKETLGKNAIYFKYKEKSQQMVKNETNLKTILSKMGFFITLSSNELDKYSVLNYYRKKDMAEKIFDNLKNEMNGSRLRVHNQTNVEAKTFINFLALILYSAINKTMQEKGLFKKFTVKEIFAELQKIKITMVKKQKPFLNEITKTQKIIFDAFNIRCQL